MAFEDFKKSPQVISEVDYDATKVIAGEGATTDNFNRTLISSINADAALESALTYLARSSSLFTTNNTKFLSHCEGKGIDVINAVAPILTTQPEDVFLPDNTFIGATWPQRAVTNMMSYGSTDSSMKTQTGWSITIPEGTGVSIISTSDDYTQVSNLNKADDIIPGDVVLSTAIIPITDAGAESLNKISGGFTFITTYNMMSTGTELIYTFDMLNDNSAVVKTQDVSLIRSEYNGVVGLENIDIPQGATKFQIHIRIKFKNSDSRASFTLKNVMVQTGGILSPYTAVQRQQCTVRYNNISNPDNGDITAMCWCTFKPYTLATHAGPIGPLFVAMPDIKIGGVHRAKDGYTLTLCLYISHTDGGEVEYGPEFTIPDEYQDNYLLSAVRIRPSEETAGKSIVEFAVCAGPTIYKSELLIDSTLIKQGDFILGTDFGATDFFNGPVTEVRYDTEWVNDTELYIISLAKKAFSFKKSNDLGASDAGDSIQDTLDKVGVNLILNPTGRLAFIGWNNYPENYFSVIHNDAYAGNAFLWVGNADNDYQIISNQMNVKASNVYTMRAVMYSNQNSAGEAGIGVTWYTQEGTEISTSKINMTHIATPKYYSLSVVAPSNAVSASVFMYVTKTLETTRLTWSRLKFEMGDATQFTDDSGAGYALYY